MHLKSWREEWTANGVIIQHNLQTVKFMFFKDELFDLKFEMLGQVPNFDARTFLLFKHMKATCISCKVKEMVFRRGMCNAGIS